MPTFSSYTVLLAEDEAMLADVFSWALEDAGFKVLRALSGDEALHLFGTEKIDLLVTDIRMPGKTDGWALATQLRKPFPELPVVYVSGYSPDSPQLPPRSIFLQKPFVPQDLIAAVEQILVPPQMTH